MDEDDYPALYRATDAASLAGQKEYVWLFASHLVLLVCAALFGAALGFVHDGCRSAVAILTGLTLLGAILARLINRDRRSDKDWFYGRAAAETVKTMAWQYMMRVEPFDSDGTCDKAFTSELQEVLKTLDRDSLRLIKSNPKERQEQITSRMRGVRHFSPAQRRDWYVKNRLHDQTEWYAAKARLNTTRANQWFWAGLGTEFAALGFAICVIAWPGTSWAGLVGAGTSLAAAFTAWSQTRRHEELSKSYALAAQELAIIGSRAEAVSTEDDLRDLVINGEGAISREHTMWIAKRR